MSNSARPRVDGERVTSRAHPRAIVHKKILAAADRDSGASVSQLASRVSGASPSLVERVLLEYSPSDSADRLESADERPPVAEGASEPDVPSRRIPDVDDVTVKQQRTLKEIHRRPDATQGDLAARFDVDRSSISHRLNNVSGFQWERRHQFVRRFFDNGQEGSDDGHPGSRPHATDAGGPADREAACSESGREHRPRGESAGTLDAALVHKVVRLCFESDDVTEREEQAVIDYLMTRPN